MTFDHHERKRDPAKGRPTVQRLDRADPSNGAARSGALRGLDYASGSAALSPGAPVVQRKPGEETADYDAQLRAALWAEGGPQPDDVHQGALQDCSLLASLSALASTCSSVITGMISVSGGVFSVRLHDDGGVVTYSVPDEQIMVIAEDGRGVIGANAEAPQGKQLRLWPMVIEAAFWQFTADRNIDIAERGVFPEFAMFTLTGKSATSTVAQGGPVESLWETLHSALRGKKRLPVTAYSMEFTTFLNTPMGAPTEEAGVEKAHAYSVLDLNGKNWKNGSVVLRNPHGVQTAGGTQDGRIELPFSKFMSYFKNITVGDYDI